MVNMKVNGKFISNMSKSHCKYIGFVQNRWKMYCFFSVLGGKLTFPLFPGIIFLNKCP